MEVIYLKRAIGDLNFWKRAGNKNVQQRIASLIDSIEKDPYRGIGKPELLKYDLRVNGLEELRKQIELFTK